MFKDIILFYQYEPLVNILHVIWSNALLPWLPFMSKLRKTCILVKGNCRESNFKKFISASYMRRCHTNTCIYWLLKLKLMNKYFNKAQ